MFVRHIKLFLEFFKQNLKVMLEYKTDFLIGVVSTFFTQASGIFFMWVIFSNVHSLNGWSFYEILFVYGMLTIAKSIDMIFFDSLLGIGWNYIREGNFDILLLRPISPLFQIVAGNLQYDGFGLLTLGLIIVSRCLIELKISLSILDVLIFIVLVVSSALIISAINLITSTSAFWTINSFFITESVASFQQFALYPITIYPKFIGFILTCVFPYAFASFYPANFFIEKGYKSYAILTPFIAILLWLIALKVWNYGVKNYTSTGS